VQGIYKKEEVWGVSRRVCVLARAMSEEAARFGERRMVVEKEEFGRAGTSRGHGRS
jgi:hypothetical protein